MNFCTFFALASKKWLKQKNKGIERFELVIRGYLKQKKAFDFIDSITFKGSGKKMYKISLFF